jgi:hypothetical protein
VRGAEQRSIRLTNQRKRRLVTVVKGFSDQTKDVFSTYHRGPHRVAAYRATGSEMARPYFLCLLAEAYTQTGRIDDG